MDDKKASKFFDIFPAPQQGNVFGWKFSIFSLILIILMAVLTWYSHKMGNEPFKLENHPEQTQIDTTQTPSE